MTPLVNGYQFQLKYIVKNYFLLQGEFPENRKQSHTGTKK